MILFDMTMKKIYVVITTFLCISCIEKSLLPVIQDISINNIECKAINTADAAMKEFYNQTKSSIRYNEEIQIIPFIKNNGDTLGVAVDYGTDNGFVYLSPDCNTVLAISDNSDFEKAIEIPAFNNMINNISLINQFPIKDPTLTPITYVVRDTSITTVSPMVQVEWHQHAPFNLYALNEIDKLAGCTPIAIAQVMSYYRYPEYLPLTFQGASTSNLYLDWDEMIENEYYHGENCAECIQKANLLRQIAEICHANYNPSSTGAWPRVEYLNRLGYTGTEYDDFAIYPITSSLENSNPCIICGFDSDSGHTWVIDGYKRIIYTEVTYELHGMGDVETDRVEYRDVYLHFNMGWGDANLTTFCLADRYVSAQGTHIYGGAIEDHSVTIFSDPQYTDVRLLVTGVKPINQ